MEFSSYHLLLPLNVFPISQLLLPVNVLLISHLQLPLSALPIGHLLLPLNVLLMSHLLLLLLDLIPISPSNLLLLLQLLYPKTPRNGSKAPWSKTKQKRKRSMLWERHNQVQWKKNRKGQCPATRRQNKEDKNQYNRGIEMKE